MSRKRHDLPPEVSVDGVLATLEKANTLAVRCRPHENARDLEM